MFSTNVFILVLNRLFLHWHQTLCDVALTLFYLLGSVQLSVDTAVRCVCGDGQIVLIHSLLIQCVCGSD